MHYIKHLLYIILFILSLNYFPLYSMKQSNQKVSLQVTSAHKNEVLSLADMCLDAFFNYYLDLSLNEKISTAKELEDVGFLQEDFSWNRSVERFIQYDPRWLLIKKDGRYENIVKQAHTTAWTEFLLDLSTINNLNIYLHKLPLTSPRKKSTLPDLSILSNLTSLQLYYGGDTRVAGSSLITLTQLKSLIISDTKICTVSPLFQHLVNLTYLQLDNTGFTSVPSHISNLSCLKHLDLSNNNLTSLPIKLTTLVSLESLMLSGNHNLNHNQIIKVISQLKNLKYLYLNDTNMRTIPANILNCTRLEQLYIKNNKFKMIPLFVAEMPHLTDVFISFHLSSGVLYNPISLENEQLLRKKNKAIHYN